MHFPFCRHLCNYCDFFKHKLESSDQITAFENKLLEQWHALSRLNSEHSVDIPFLETFYIGGGTPSLWGEAGVRFVRENILNTLSFSDSYEFTLEVDPDAWDENTLAQWFEIGVNRVSIGAQAFDDQVLAVLDRSHRKKHIIALVSFLQKRNINTSVDLLIGAPQLMKRNTLEECRQLIDLAPQHFSVYILKTRKNYPHNEFMPEDEVAEEYLDVVQLLKASGYHQYEISNFAQTDYESRHNLKYWKAENVAAIGPNATGAIYQSNGLLRYQWKNIATGFSSEQVEGESLILERLFLGLRTREGLKVDEIFPKTYEKAIWTELYEQWQTRGYLSQLSTPQVMVLSPKGMLMSDSIVDDIFRKKLL